MKKILAALAALAVLFSNASFANDLNVDWNKVDEAIFKADLVVPKLTQKGKSWDRIGRSGLPYITAQEKKINKAPVIDSSEYKLSVSSECKNTTSCTIEVVITGNEFYLVIADVDALKYQKMAHLKCNLTDSEVCTGAALEEGFKISNFRIN